jgi:hypothetical protein
VSRPERKIPREEIIAIVVFFFVSALIGAAAGYGARYISSRDRWMISQVERNQSEQEYYQKQIAQIVTEGSQPPKEQNYDKKAH